MPPLMPTPQPSAVLDPANADQIRAWADSLHISRTTLVHAVQTAGTDMQAIVAYLQAQGHLD